jgi:hypothetical protein
MTMERNDARPLRFRLRVEARSRWKAWLGLALAIGIGSGIALAAAAGARRTYSAYPRFLAGNEVEDAIIGVNPPRGSVTEASRIQTEIERLPQVERAGRTPQLMTAVAATAKAAPVAAAQNIGSMGLVGGFGYEFARPRLVSGRMPDRGRFDEVLINPLFATAHHLHVGSRFRLWVLDSGALDRASAHDAPYAGSLDHPDLTVAGIGRFARDLAPTTVLDAQPLAYVTPAFYEKYPAALANLVSRVRLRPGASIEEYRSAVVHVAAQHGAPASDVFFASERDRTTTVARAVRPQWLSLSLLALFVGLAALLVIGQALSRQAFVDATDSPILGAIGMTRRQRAQLGLARVALVSITGAAVALVIAVALSPLFPIGLARDAEPSPGLAFDAVVLMTGFGVVAIAFVLRGALAAWRGACARPGVLDVGDLSPAHPSRLAAVLSRTGVRPAPVLGVRMAFEPGRGRTAVPVRSALVVSALAVGAVVAVLTFAASLDRLIATPSRYGWGWTGSIGFGFDPIPSSVTKALVADNHLSAVAGSNYVDATVGGRTVTAVTFDNLKGELGPKILEGRGLRADNELVLGTQTMRDASLEVGDRARIRLEDKPVTVRIVGRAVFPRLGAGSFSPTDIGRGAALTNTTLTRLENGRATIDPAGYSVFFVRAKKGMPARQLESTVGRVPVLVSECGSACISGPQRPGDIIAYSKVRSTAGVLIALLALMALAALTHSLVTSVRRRRRDFAVLKTLGFTTRQIASAARWQGLAMAGAALLIGVPLGVALGRWLWTLFADRLGVAGDALTPAVATAIAVPATLLIAALIAAIPARLARRTPTAEVLRRA